MLFTSSGSVLVAGGILACASFTGREWANSVSDTYTRYVSLQDASCFNSESTPAFLLGENFRATMSSNVSPASTRFSENGSFLRGMSNNFLPF